jgi:hypothetical protein
MQQLYANRTGIANPEDFNCVHVVLSKNDLFDLQKDIIDGNIRPVSGFFFGQTEIYPEQKKHVMEAIALALLEVSEGKVVTYSAWF